MTENTCDGRYLIYENPSSLRVSTACFLLNLLFGVIDAAYICVSKKAFVDCPNVLFVFICNFGSISTS